VAQSIAEKVKSNIADILGVSEAEVTSSSTLMDLGCDSLDVVELIMWMEEEFDIETPDDEIEKILTVQDVVSYIEGKLSAKKAS
jgi:acyl carrier protein